MEPNTDKKYEALVSRVNGGSFFEAVLGGLDEDSRSDYTLNPSGVESSESDAESSSESEGYFEEDSQSSSSSEGYFESSSESSCVSEDETKDEESYLESDSDTDYMESDSEDDEKKPSKKCKSKETLEGINDSLEDLLKTI